MHRAEEQRRDVVRSASHEQPMTSSQYPRCGLCGKTKNLTKTECCHEWICDDDANYVMLS